MDEQDSTEILRETIRQQIGQLRNKLLDDLLRAGTMDDRDSAEVQETTKQQIGQLREKLIDHLLRAGAVDERDSDEVQETAKQQIGQLRKKLIYLLSARAMDKRNSAETHQETTKQPGHLRKNDLDLSRTAMEEQDSAEILRETTAKQQLSQLRKKLLDLSNRNRFLNFKHSATSRKQVRLVNTSLNELHELLVSQQRAPFRGIPDPDSDEESADLAVELSEQHDVVLHRRGDAISMEFESVAQHQAKQKVSVEELARKIGIDPSFELPLDSTNPRNGRPIFQTCLLESKMDTTVGGLRDEFRTILQELGINTLYCALGFLEWYEADASDKALLSPLLLHPMEMERTLERQKYQYQAWGISEDTECNVTLAERLAADFGLQIPDFTEESTLSSYFSELEELIASKKRWRVLPFATIGIFNFSRLAMYKDLDPNLRPPGKELEKHAVVGDLLGGIVDADASSSDGSDPFVSEYIRPAAALVKDADSSQYRAIVEAMGGRNLVIEGPPGTGKSQTITNVIASAMKEGKTVLFVAEKLAALQVVKNRLDAVGLGDFCLELHSTKARKTEVLESFRSRLNAEATPFSDIAGDLGRLEDCKNKITSHVDALHSQFGRTGKTVFDLIWDQQLSRSKVEENLGNLAAAEIESTELFDTQDLENVRQAFSTLSTTASSIENRYGSIERHPWFGARAVQQGAQTLAKALQSLKASLATLMPATDTVARLLAYDSDISLAELGELSAIAGRLGDEFVTFNETAIGELSDGANFTGLRNFLTELERFQGTEQSLEREQPWTTLPTFRENLHELELLLGKCSEHTSVEFARSDITDRVQLLREEAELYQHLHALATELRAVFGAADEWTASTHLLALAARMLLKADRKTLLSRTAALWDESNYDLIGDASSRWQHLQNQRKSLGERYRVGEAAAVPLREHAARLQRTGTFSFLDPHVRNARRAFKMLQSSGTRTADAQAAQELLEIAEHVEAVAAFENHKDVKAALGEHFSGMETDFELFLKAAQLSRDLRLTLPSGAAARLIRHQIRDAEIPWIDNVREVASDPLFEQLIEHTAPQSKDADLLNRAQENEAAAVALRELEPELGRVNYPPNQNLSDLHDVIQNVRALSDLQGIVASSSVAQDVLGDTFAGARTDAAEVKRLLQCSELIRSSAVSQPLQVSLAQSTRETRLALKESLDATLEALGEAKSAVTDLTKAGVDTEAFFNCDDWMKNGPRALMTRACYALDNIELFDDWKRYVIARGQIETHGAGDIILVFDRLRSKCDPLDAFNYVFLRSLIKAAYSKYPVLEQFSGDGLSAIRKKFCELDNQLLKRNALFVRGLLSRKFINPGNRVGQKSTYTEAALIRNELGKVKRHVPLRELVKRAGTAMQQLKPCFMMSPLSVAQFISWDSVGFDIVVIDEASQMRPEDSIGAVSRGAQLVVVGDPKQLPPTTFFDRLEEFFDESDEEAEDSESILDLAAKQYHPPSRLLWHYRSRDPGLIAFSNHHFYDDELIVFPSPDSTRRTTGVSSRYVGGEYRSSVNLTEAKAVAEAALEFMRTHDDMSLGVVAMNQPQRELILAEIEMLLARDPLAARYVEQWEGRLEPFFVKNLESVQGDERDVIMISTVYGPDASGNVMQRFGPINNKNGWRRLNVLFTRSKYRIELFTSMRPYEIIVDEHTSRGARALRDYLQYAEHGILEVGVATNREPQSEFEVAVAQVLRNAGYQVATQVGVAGYFIDLAVCHPSSASLFILGIECDGATYHRAKSARDRDRLREEVLRNLGWKLHRIWSTDWFTNPRREIEKLLAAVERELGKAPAEELERTFERPSEEPNIS